MPAAISLRTAAWGKPMMVSWIRVLNAGETATTTSFGSEPRSAGPVSAKVSFPAAVAVIVAVPPEAGAAAAGSAAGGVAAESSAVISWTTCAMICLRVFTSMLMAHLRCFRG